jgi:cytochrome c
LQAQAVFLYLRLRSAALVITCGKEQDRPMDSWEFSKIAGGVLLALLAIVLPKTLIEMNAESAAHGGHAAVGYELPLPAGAAKPAAVAKASGAGGAAPVKPTGEPMKIAAVADGAKSTDAPAAAAAGGIFDQVKPLLAAAKPEAGAATFKACLACHSPEKGGAAKVGPGLWGVVGRPKGSVDGFNYSATLKGMGGDWSYDKLAGFINNPKAYAAGTKMLYAGINDPEKLADVLAYLGTLSDNPVPLPK